MLKQDKTKEGRLQIYLIPLLVIILIFILVGFIIINLIKINLFNHMMDDSNRLAEIHMDSMSNTIDANHIINELLEDRLIGTADRVIKNYKNLGNSMLEEIAKDFNIDKIYWYDSNGEIIYSANDYIGWSTNIGDPEYEFMVSEDKVLVEEIREDIDSGELLKYAFKKINNGEFVQVGILAENIYDLTKKFCPLEFTSNLEARDDIVYAFYLDNHGYPASCYHESHIREYKIDRVEREALEKDEKLFTKKSYRGKEVYEAMLPIYVEGEKHGSLILLYALDRTNELIVKFSYAFIVFLLSIFLIYGIMVFNTIKKNREIEKLAYYDPITNLYNKDYFMKFMTEELVKNHKKRSAIIILKFKGLNLVKLVYGQDYLHSVLIGIKNALEKIENIEDFIFRYSEDSFCIYIDDYKLDDDLINLSNQIVDIVDEICSSEENSELLSSRTGILEIKNKEKNINQLIKYIDLVLDKLHKEGNLGYGFFDETIKRDLLLNEKIEKELRKEIHSGCEGFYLVYQPQLDFRSGKVIGLEALTRWKNKEVGRISPLVFIEIAEKFQLINQLGDWIINEALNFMKTMESLQLLDIKLSINISAVQILQEDFIDNLKYKIKRFDINPENLILEITESVLMKDYGNVNKKLEILKREGINVALDDFGIGYASLARLRDLNIDILKIDKSFIDQIKDSEKEDIFINSILALAKELKLKTVAEGVETEEQRGYLKARQCDVLQGYLFSKPIIGNRAVEIIKESNKNLGGRK